MASKLRFIMSCLNFRVRILIFMSIFIFTGTVGAEVLSPPTKIPFAKDVIIEKYSHGQPLKLFRYNGDWEVKPVGKGLSIIGNANEAPVYLISNDKLSRKPKSLKMDFIIKDAAKEYGFIFGDIGIIVKNNRIYPAIFDRKTNMLKANSNKDKPINIEGFNKLCTLDINTGYDPTGGSNQTCVIYINGVGLTFNCPNTDVPFGVYLSAQNGIAISNIRWSIGNK